MSHIQDLLDNGWITECTGPWGSMIVLAAKPHQEPITWVEDFIWRMCISYRKLNSMTRPFEYPIPRCNDAIEDFGNAHGTLFMMSLDNWLGYHQIAVNQADQEKLAFFGPDDKKYTFRVMPFGPQNAPAVYTAMMRCLQTQWEALFTSTHPHNTAHYGCRIIIDNIIAWSTSQETLTDYLACMLRIFLKYRLSLKLSKCDFLKTRVEYVGHGLQPKGNSPAQSKFCMINDWPTPTTLGSLHSFMSLCNFYAKYCPYFKVNLSPYRTLLRTGTRDTPIKPTDWTPELEALFLKLKHDLTSSPVLARFDSTNPAFLKTDYSSFGMGYVLMQPDNSASSFAAVARLTEGCDNDFDTTMKGARLCPVKFGSRRCDRSKQSYHSFVGETACGRWAICHNRPHLYGQHFFWLCDCSAVKEVLCYEGDIHQVRRWAQELLGYDFTVLHQPSRMMQDADALSRFYGPLISAHLSIAHSLATSDHASRPFAYASTAFPQHTVRRPTHPPPGYTIEPPVPPTPNHATTLVNIPVRILPVPTHTSRPPPSHSAQSSTNVFVTARHCHWYSIHPGFGTISAALSLHSTLGTFVFSAIHASLPHANLGQTHFQFDHSHIASLSDIISICSTLAASTPAIPTPSKRQRQLPPVCRTAPVRPTSAPPQLQPHTATGHHATRDNPVQTTHQPDVSTLNLCSHDVTAPRPIDPSTKHRPTDPAIRPTNPFTKPHATDPITPPRPLDPAHPSRPHNTMGTTHAPEPITSPPTPPPNHVPTVPHSNPPATTTVVQTPSGTSGYATPTTYRNTPGREQLPDPCTPSTRRITWEHHSAMLDRTSATTYAPPPNHDHSEDDTGSHRSLPRPYPSLLAASSLAPGYQPSPDARFRLPLPSHHSARAALLASPSLLPNPDAPHRAPNVFRLPLVGTLTFLHRQQQPLAHPPSPSPATGLVALQQLPLLVAPRRRSGRDPVDRHMFSTPHTPGNPQLNPFGTRPGHPPGNP